MVRVSKHIVGLLRAFERHAVPISQLRGSRRLVFLVSLFAAYAPVASALTCGDMAYGTDQYRGRMQQLAKQANLSGGSYTKYHERVVNDVCQDDEDDAKKMVAVGYVSAKEVSSIQRVLQGPSASANVAATTPTPKPASATDLAIMNKAIDRAFVQWSTQWMWDRYIPESTTIRTGSTWCVEAFDSIEEAPLRTYRLPLICSGKSQLGSSLPFATTTRPAA